MVRASLRSMIPAVILAAGCVRATAPRVTTVPSIAASNGNASGPVQQQGYPMAAVNGNASRESVRFPDDLSTSTSGVAADAVPAVARDVTVVTAPPPSWDIEVRSYESTERVERYVKLFSGPARERIEQRLDRGTRYEAMIRAKMREGGLPEDMYYLALVESGFDPNAYSRAAAVGMWQFMTSTARDVGLRVDWWVDERRDPMKSTDAAVRFLKELNEQFGSLYLAAAAYNGGPGRIARGLTRYADDLEGTAGDDLFFALADKDYLRNETREYVPQLIASALIAKEPARYGMTITPEPAFTYDSVRVAPFTPLTAVALAADASVSALQDLNPHLLRGVTPPKDSSYVRVPTGSGADFDSAYAALPASDKAAVSHLETRTGESAGAIASHAGITIHQLEQYNPNLRRLKSGKLMPGQTLLVPTALVASAAVAVPDPTIERYSTPKSAATVHVVKSGETLGAIAKRYDVTVPALMSANELRRPLILAGQTLVIRGAKVPEKSYAAASGTSSKKAASPVKKATSPVKRATTTLAKKSSPAKKARSSAKKASSGAKKAPTHVWSSRTAAKRKKPAA